MEPSSKLASLAGGSSTAAAAVWVPDEARSRCAQCGQRFSVFTRKHHCRACLDIFCSQCSAHSKLIYDPKLGARRPARVCDRCLTAQQQPHPLPRRRRQPQRQQQQQRQTQEEKQHHQQQQPHTLHKTYDAHRVTTVAGFSPSPQPTKSITSTNGIASATAVGSPAIGHNNSDNDNSNSAAQKLQHRAGEAKNAKYKAVSTEASPPRQQTSFRTRAMHTHDTSPDAIGHNANQARIQNGELPAASAPADYSGVHLTKDHGKGSSDTTTTVEGQQAYRNDVVGSSAARNSVTEELTISHRAKGSASRDTATGGTTHATGSMTVSNGGGYGCVSCDVYSSEMGRIRDLFAQYILRIDQGGSKEHRSREIGAASINGKKALLPTADRLRALSAVAQSMSDEHQAVIADCRFLHEVVFRHELRILAEKKIDLALREEERVLNRKMWLLDDAVADAQHEAERLKDMHIESKLKEARAQLVAVQQRIKDGAVEESADNAAALVVSSTSE